MEGNSLKSFENLCKIFEMRIKLDREKNIETPEDVLINYEKYSKKIDSIYNSDFEKNVKPLITPAATLEKEEERLKKLIKLLEDRLEKRESLENKFYMSTGRYIKGLQLVVSESELNEKKDRLELITKYLDTKNEIGSITQSIAKLKNSLLEEEKKKEKYSSKNKIIEDELYSSFVDMIKEENYFSNISEDNIDTELVNILDKVKETKETLDVTKDSVSSLMFNGSNDDYSSYIEDAEKGYFIWKNRELLLRIYELVIKFEENFSDIYDKREKIFSLIKRRKNLRESLNIDTTDELLSFEKLLLGQMNILKEEKEILENISNYTNRINFKEERLNELEEENNSVEILSILREYGLIDTYDTEEIPSNFDEDILDEETLDEIIHDPIIKEVIDPYRIVEVKDYPKTLNVGLAKLKGESVREKVNKKLNPKKQGPTFEDMTASLENKNNTLKVDIPKTEDIKKEVKSLDTDVENKDAESSTESKVPVWDIPSVTSIKPIELEDNLPEENNNSSVPIWYEMKPFTSPPNEEKDEVVNLDINSVNNRDIINDTSISTSSNNDGNMFWVPVSDTKLEANNFPNINIPVGNNFTSGNDNFGFPDLNN